MNARCAGFALALAIITPIGVTGVGILSGCSAVVVSPAGCGSSDPPDADSDAVTADGASPALELTSLTVTPALLTPDFAPSIHD
ncbi:hypothetical protein BH09MYX1_BH09MYX1_52390 [soil metagenome]